MAAAVPDCLGGLAVVWDCLRTHAGGELMIGLFLPSPRQANVVGDPGFTSRIIELDSVRRPSSKITVTDDVALTYSAVWAATRLLSGTLGWLPLDMYRRLPGGDGREVVTDDPRERLVHDQPNGEMRSMMFRCQAVAQQVNSGNCYAEIERDGSGNPTALWPIHHTRVTPIRDEKTDELFYEVKNNRAAPTYLATREMFHVPSINSDDGITGKGVIRYARESIGLGIAAERTGASHLGTGGIPRIVVEHPKRFNPESRQSFRKDWHELYGGPDGDKMALLEEGAVAKPLNISMTDAQYLETRQFAIEEIARWYGIPPHKLQHLMRSTFSNIEHQAIEWVTDCLMMWIKVWEQELWAKLLTPKEQEEYFFEFNTNALMRGDSKARAEFYRLMSFIGALSPNEIRAYENLNPYSGGNVYVIQQAMIPVDKIGEVIDAQIESATQPAQPADGSPNQAALVVSAVAHQLSGLEQRLRASTSATVNTLRLELDERITAAQSTTDNREAVLLNAARELLTGAVGRMVRKEAVAARRAAGKPGEFLAWLDTFYCDAHCQTYQEAIQTPINAIVALGYVVDAKSLATSQTASSKATLLDLSGGCTAVELPAKIEACVAEWEVNRPASVADGILNKGA